MKPVSPTAAFLLRLCDAVPPLIVFGLAGWAALWMAGFSDLSLGLWIPICFTAAGAIAYMSRPLRKAAYLGFSKALVHSSSTVLIEVGVFRLLKVGHRFWPQDPVTDFVGISALHACYDHMDES